MNVISSYIDTKNLINISYGYSKSSLNWFWSYLSRRSLCVTSKHSTSLSRDINICIPQGSVLGPLLFCIYMNDIQDHLSENNIFRLLYADDFQIYIQIPVHKIEQGILYLSEIAKKVSTWAVINLLALNIKKTQAIIFGSSSTIKYFKALNISHIDVNNKKVTGFLLLVK